MKPGFSLGSLQPGAESTSEIGISREIIKLSHLTADHTIRIATAAHRGE
jgi:hypothetical protein